MKTLARLWLGALIVTLSSVARPQTLVQNLLWTVPPEYVLDKTFAATHWNVELFCQPHAGSIAHVLQPGSGTVSKFAVFADRCWNRLIYVADGYPEVRAFGGPGTGQNQFRVPQVVKVVAPNDQYRVPAYYNIFVGDNLNNRIQHLRYNWQNHAAGIAPVRYFSGPLLPSPIDFDHDDFGTPSAESDDRLWVINGNNTLVAVNVASGVPFQFYGGTGSGIGQFNGLLAVACGRDFNTRANNGTIFVVDGGNGRIVRLRYSGGTFLWEREFTNPYLVSAIVDLEVDGAGMLWAIMEHGLVWKFNANLDQLDELAMAGVSENQLSSPTSVSNSGGFYPTGGMMFTEAWTEQTGIKGFTIGIDVKDAYANSFLAGSSCQANLSIRLTDVAYVLRVKVYKSNGTLVKSVASYSTVQPGHHTYLWDGRNTQSVIQPAGAYYFEVYAESYYWNPSTGQVSAVVTDTIPFTHCGVPCTWLVGDADGNGAYSIADAVYISNYIFASGQAPQPHAVGSGDATCDGSVSIADAIFLINMIFSGGPSPTCECSAYQIPPSK